jgi:hypothetical protein
MGVKEDGGTRVVFQFYFNKSNFNFSLPLQGGGNQRFS